MATKKKKTKKVAVKKKKAAPKKAAAPKKKKAAPKKKKVAATTKKATTTAAAAPKKKKVADVLPTAAEEARFWSLIEDAWATQSAEVNEARNALATRDPGDEPDDEMNLVDDALEDVVEALHSVFVFEDFPKDELVAMDRVIERKLYDIDRSEIQEVTDGSDDGFLYARGYIVALGKKFYDAVNKNPSMAIPDAECEEMCYLPAQSHEERFGDYPDTQAKISRETCSNSKGWANAD